MQLGARHIVKFCACVCGAVPGGTEMGAGRGSGLAARPPFVWKAEQSTYGV